MLKVYAPDPHRPRVRVIVDAKGGRLQKPYDGNLWESEPDSEWPASVVAPLDPADHQIDPLAIL